VTPDWVTAALRAWHPAVEVTSVSVSHLRQGSNTTARLELTYSGQSGLPATMWVKGTWTGRNTGGLVPETRFYQEVAPRLSVNRPEVFFAGVTLPDRATLLLEDLTVRGVRFGTASDSAGVDQVAALLDMLAELHALDWGRDSLMRSDWLAPRFRADDPESEEGIFGSFRESWWDKQIARPRAADVPEPLRDRLVVKRALAQLYRFEAEPDSPVCLVHGDMHLGNTFFETDGRPGILDWPCGVGHWAHDITYGIVSWLDTETRRAHDRELFEHYLARLEAHGGPRLERDAAWLDWRRHLIHGFMWVMCSPRQQPEDLITQQTSRFAAAAQDHDMLAALDVKEQ
jgi:aminoglycoside phosphotransferase (APT) family kinase protein